MMQVSHILQLNIYVKLTKLCEQELSLGTTGRMFL